MSEAKVFLDARRQLMIDHGVGKVGFIEFGTRGGSLVELIDEARTPVADKALSLWLDSGTPHLKGWLREQSADVILQAAGPDKFNVCIGPFPAWLLGAAVNVIEFDIAFPSARLFNPNSILSQVLYPLREKCADAVAFSWGIRTRSIEDFQRITRERSAERLINDCGNDLEDFNSKRQPVADAAWFLLERGIADGHSTLNKCSAEHILYCARARQDAISVKREPVADAAQVLFTVFGYNASQAWSLSDPVATLNRVNSKREEFADAARAFWLTAPAPDAGITMARSLDQLVRDARYWRDSRMADHVREAVAIANGMHRPGASDRIHKIAALLLEEEAAHEGR